MDQEKFEQNLMGYLFDELDEVTRAAMKRKLEADAQCREIEAGLRATIEVGKLPLEDPSDDLEERILAAVEIAQRGEPWHTKLVRALAWAGSHAMKPQLAMAALVVLVLGSSLLLLRVRPGAVAVAPSKDESAVPAVAPLTHDEASEPEATAATPPAELAQAAPMASGAADAAEDAKAGKADDKELAALEEQYKRGLQNYDAGKFGEAQKDFDAVSQSASNKAASASLYKARAVRAESGCPAAVRHYDSVRQRHGSSGIGADATMEQADCYVQMGNRAEARKLWLAMAENPDYKERALASLSSEGEVGTSAKTATASPRRSAAAQEAPSGGSGARAKAAPKPAAPPRSASGL